MANLHQLLAVKKDATQRSNEIAGETKKALGAKHLFSGATKSYTPFDEEDKTRFPDESEQLSYTVGEKLRWFGEQFGRALDIEYQIDKTNEQAYATLSVGDDLDIGEVPATFLLDLISTLERIRKVYTGIPVLDPKYQWEPDETAGPGVFRTSEPEITYRSTKVLRHKVLYDATKDHPAQIEKWPEDCQVGKYTKQLWSGALTPAQKAIILGRVDKLLIAAKQALSKANNAEHSTEKIANNIFDYLHRGIATEGIYRGEETVEF
jgi:hypothetical protein